MTDPFRPLGYSRAIWIAALIWLIGFITAMLWPM